MSYLVGTPKTGFLMTRLILFWCVIFSKPDKVTDNREYVKDIDFDGLLEHFKMVQARHREARKRHTAFLLPYKK